MEAYYVVLAGVEFGGMVERYFHPAAFGADHVEREGLRCNLDVGVACSFPYAGFKLAFVGLQPYAHGLHHESFHLLLREVGGSEGMAYVVVLGRVVAACVFLSFGRAYALDAGLGCAAERVEP